MCFLFKKNVILVIELTFVLFISVVNSWRQQNGFWGWVKNLLVRPHRLSHPVGDLCLQRALLLQSEVAGEYPSPRVTAVVQHLTCASDLSWLGRLILCFWEFQSPTLFSLEYLGTAICQFLWYQWLLWSVKETVVGNLFCLLIAGLVNHPRPQELRTTVDCVLAPQWLAHGWITGWTHCHCRCPSPCSREWKLGSLFWEAGGCGRAYEAEI